MFNDQQQQQHQVCTKKERERKIKLWGCSESFGGERKKKKQHERHLGRKLKLRQQETNQRSPANMMPNSVINKTNEQQDCLSRLSFQEKRADKKVAMLVGGKAPVSCKTKRRLSPLAQFGAKRALASARSFLVLLSFSSLLLLLANSGTSLIQQVASSSSFITIEQSSFSDAFGAGSGSSSSSQRQLQQRNFDQSNHKSIQEAVRAHPDLREFANLCEAQGVKEIMSLATMPLTVFAPIDRALSDLLEKSNSRPINLIELAKHHIAQGSIRPKANPKSPQQFSTFSMISPLYLNQVSTNHGPALYVNNAKVLSTHKIPINGGTKHQILYVIDQVLEFAYVKQEPQEAAGSGNMGGVAQAEVGAFNLDELASQPEVAQEFYERFGDISAGQARVDLFHARAFKGSQQQRVSLTKQELHLERLFQFARQHAPQLRGKLFQVNESSSFNTYFLPVNSEELDALLDGGSSSQLNAAALEAHIIPDQVLFTRQLSLGQSHASLLTRSLASTSSQQPSVALSLAKTLPFAARSNNLNDEESRLYLATPLLLQSHCSQTTSANQASVCRPGVTSAEILVANIPLNNGVLHLIKRPILITDLNVLDYLNDSDNQLSNVVNALGSQTANNKRQPLDLDATPSSVTPVKVNRFRELLARERQMLSTFSTEPAMNKTILAPSDEAFAGLRFDLRALVQGDESLIPKHWDSSYRQDLLERLVKRHVVLHQTLTSEQLASAASANLQQTLSDNGKPLTFSALTNGELQVESDGTRARLLHRDLIGTNGVLHVIDRVLGEEQETVHSLLRANVLRLNHSLAEEAKAPSEELGQLIQANLRQVRQQQQETMISATNSIAATQESAGATQKVEQSPELAAIRKAITQYLEELASSNQRQLQLLAGSVNISYQLARLTSLAEGLDDWNDKFKQAERSFTYFVPSDLAWIKLQQAQPELHKPLALILEQQSELADALESSLGDSTSASNQLTKVPRFSESSHRLRQILERHLVSNRKISQRDLTQLESVQTGGATLRLQEAANGNGGQQQVTAFESGAQTQPASGFAALHSIIGGSNNNNAAAFSQAALKTLRLDASSANIVSASEASNGMVYVIDNVLLLPNDAEHIVLTSAAPAISSTMSSLLGAHNSAILDFIHNLLAPSPIAMSANSIIALLGTLMLAIAFLLVLATVLIVRRRRQNKLNRHQQLESGLTSSSSANSGSTSTTKSL